MRKVVSLIIPALLALYGLIVVIDYFLPYSVKTAEIESIVREDVHRSGRSRKTYSIYRIKIDGESIRTDSETFQRDHGATEAQVFRTKILRKVIKLETTGFPIHIRNFPFFLFPVVPGLLLLPFIAFQLKGRHNFFESLGQFSLLIAAVLFVMSLI